jgi:hypothetical protein
MHVRCAVGVGLGVVMGDKSRASSFGIWNRSDSINCVGLVDRCEKCESVGRVSAGDRVFAIHYSFFIRANSKSHGHSVCL